MTAVTSSAQSHNDDSFENPAYNNNLYSDLQQPSAPVAGAAGGGGGGDGDNHEEPPVMHESVDDQQKSQQVQPSFETFKGNWAIFYRNFWLF